jgi:hypothetical protein
VRQRSEERTTYEGVRGGRSSRRERVDEEMGRDLADGRSVFLGRSAMVLFARRAWLGAQALAALFSALANCAAVLCRDPCSGSLQ